MPTVTGMIISAESAAGLFPAVPPAAAIPAAALNRIITMVIAAGNAAGLFPVITPAAGAAPNLNSATSTRTGTGSPADLPPGVSSTATPSPVPATGPRAAERSAGPAADASAASPGWQALAVVLIAVALAIMLAMTRLFARRSTGARGR